MNTSLTLQGKQFLIYGCSQRGLQILSFLQRYGGECIGFIDKKSSKRMINGIRVYYIEELEKLNINQDVIIILATIKQDIEQEMRDAVSAIGLKRRLMNNYNFYREIEMQFEMNRTSQSYDIDFDNNFKEWISNILSEVDFWKNQVAATKGSWHYTYESKYTPKPFVCKRLSNYMITPKEIILDVGCGLCSQYGNISFDGQPLNICGVDPLASFYNEINRRYFDEHDVKYDLPKIAFGLFEVLSYFFPEAYADYILIDNALDHCIDPYTSILECLKVLKIGGVLSTAHHTNEAHREFYNGLHKWNICGLNNDLIVWNNVHYINISKELADCVEIELIVDNNVTADSPYGRTICNLKKIRNIDCLIDDSSSKERIHSILNGMMEKLSSVNYALELLHVMFK